tara:strand:+ start:751 stop:2400 length:1650 start_codon:yes stop_codon:yes gene_type:complete
MLLAYGNVPTVFRAVTLMASSMAMVPVVLFENMPEEAFAGTIGTPSLGGTVIDPLQGQASMGEERPRVQKRVYADTLANLIQKAEVGSADEFTHAATSLNQGTREVRVDAHPLLRLLRRPNRDLTTYELFFKTYAYLELTGNCYWILTRDSATGDVNGIYVPKPHRVEPASKDGKKGFNRKVLRNGEETTRFWDWEDVIHFKTFSPVSDVMGMPQLQPLTQAMLTDLYATRWNKDFFKNSARPDVLLMFDERLDDDTYKRLLAEWNIMFSGWSKTHRPAIVEGGSKIQLLSESRADMEFVEQRAFSRTEMLTTMGVHPAIMGLHSEDSDSQELATIRRMFWEDTLLPKMAYVSGVMEQYLFPKVHPIPAEAFDTAIRMNAETLNIGDPNNPLDALRALATIRRQEHPIEEELDKFAVRFDTQTVPALRDAAVDESQIALRYVQSGIHTINEVRKEQNRPPVEWGDAPPLTTPVGASLMRGDVNENRTLQEPRHSLSPADLGAEDQQLRDALVNAKAAKARREHIEAKRKRERLTKGLTAIANAKARAGG